ncbi:DUF2461 domain-containing protein [Capillimicrobium parvum]|uniref:TIGR02453 family protein n=1 Tax=Capillimicrobium parvum TaxID=2884022 RepID=A0A9E6Y124_9ACTN|nr:DUF2461 domain-containing protein [Capillimicrobium parvum]UGS38139.1 hypothetical protein DSM104329_04562 [Capillimicrobium parvum]
MFAFPPQTQDFLRDLSAHNDREWFDAHRAEYQAAYVEPARAFVAAVAPELERIAPGVCAEPRVLGSIFRINRDTRFSRDKRPYKEHLDLWFWEGERRTARSGFYLRVTPELVGIGAGANHLSREAIDRYRAAVCDAEAGAELAQIVSALETDGWDLAEPRLKRAPRGWTAVDPDAEPLLRRDSLFIARQEPAERATDADRLVPACVEAWSALAPLHRWLVAHVQ